jgi:hypothetical protein
VRDEACGIRAQVLPERGDDGGEHATDALRLFHELLLEIGNGGSLEAGRE